jgi:UPF0755 protein
MGPQQVPRTAPPASCADGASGGAAMSIGRLLPVILAATLAAGALGYHAYREAEAPFRGFAGDEIFIPVTAGEPSRAIARSLQDSGVIKDAGLFLVLLKLRGKAGGLQAGEYRFTEPASLLEVMDRLVAGDVYYRSVTIPEGLTLWETADLLSQRGLGDGAALRAAFGRGALVASLDPRAGDLEGYLFPETYRFVRNPTPDEVAAALVDRFVSVFDDRRRRRAQELGLGVREVVTLASVVEKETGLENERPLIASVFWNRLKRRMPLQSDPTIIYDLKRRGVFDGDIRRRDLKLDSPYNTYRQAGLPPGPIASPGTGAIDAVLHPAESDHLYFVSRNDGSHQFSNTLPEHNAAVRRFQIDHARKERRARSRRQS